MYKKIVTFALTAYMTVVPSVAIKDDSMSLYEARLESIILQDKVKPSEIPSCPEECRFHDKNGSRICLSENYETIQVLSGNKTMAYSIYVLDHVTDEKYLIRKLRNKSLTQKKLNL